ncbi:hypothetical protein EK904_005745 [Melospiza melodia maxima]|nr:hypothetical protein EK904_005745 [Melospiza melodia maxima]
MLLTMGNTCGMVTQLVERLAASRRRHHHQACHLLATMEQHAAAVRAATELRQSVAVCSAVSDSIWISNRKVPNICSLVQK